MIKLHLFGVVSLRNGSGEMLSALLAHAKPTALIAILAHAAPDPVRRDLLLALLWPELDEPRARNALSKALHLCRRTLGEDALITIGTEAVALNASRWWCDVHAFRAAVERGDAHEALSLFRQGELLAGFHVADAPGFEEWLDDGRASLRRLAIGVITEALEAAIASGDLPCAAEWAAQHCALDPYDEVALRRLLELLDRVGGRAGALRAYQQQRTRLQRELGVEPAPETEALVTRIRQRMVAGPGELPSGVIGGVVAPAAGVGPPVRSRRRWPWLIAAASVSVALLVGLPAFDVGQVDEGQVLLVSFEGPGEDSTLTLLGEVLSDLITRSVLETGLADAVNARARLYGPGMGLGTQADPGPGSLGELARRLGVTAVIHGQVSQTGETIRVALEVRGPDGIRVMRALGAVTGGRTDLAPVIEQVRTRVQGWLAASADPRMVAWATTASQPPAYDAYVAYIQALHHLGARDRAGAIRYLELAVARDSGFVAAAGWLVRQYNTLELRPRADSLVAHLQGRRESLAPYDAVMVDQLDAYLRGDRIGMLDAARRMLRFSTRSPDANWWHGYAAVATGHLAEGLEAFDRLERGAGWTLETRDGSLFWPMTAHHLLGDFEGELARIRGFKDRNGEDHWVCVQELRVQLLLGERDDVEHRIGRCIALVPLSDQSFPARAWWYLGRDLRLHGEREEGGRLVRESVRLAREALAANPSSQILREQLGEVLMEAGEWDEARAVWEAVLPGMGGGRPPRVAGQAGVAAARAGDVAFALYALELLTVGTRQEFPWHRSRVLASLGRRDEAMAELERAVAMGMSMAELAHTDVGFELLRGYPPYEALVRPRQAPLGAFARR